MLIIQIAVYGLLIASLYAYYLNVRMSKLEKEIRKENLEYSCFRCKNIISINDKICPKCEFETIYGKRKKKQWLIAVIIITWLFVVRKLSNQGLF